MTFTFVLSAVAFLANLAVILFLTQLRERERYVRPMIGLYICLAGFNLGLTFMVTAPSAERAWFILFLFRPFLFFIGPCFLWTCVTLTGVDTVGQRVGRRVWIGASFALGLFMTVASGAGYLSGSRFFISEMQLLPWGYIPLAGPGAAFGLGGLLVLTIPGSFILLWSKQRLLADVSRDMMIGLFALWWGGLLTNGFGLAGFKVFPLGSAIDAVMSFIITAYLHRHVPPGSGSRLILRIAGMLASLCPGAMATYFLLEFVLPDAPVVNGLVGLVTAGVALYVFQRWFSTNAQAGPTRIGTPLFVRLQNEYELTYQEARICEEAYLGQPREAILEMLKITDGTFRNHLSEIYRKTIDPVEATTSARRDKWQRLTVFLHKIADS